MTDEIERLEDITNKRKRLVFRSWHRGTKEMDLLMGSFADRYVQGFSEDDLSEYDDILKCNDPDLYNWISGKEEAPANLSCGTVFQMLLKHQFVEK